ncbi:CLUMA_CG019687, isoform A [Clunio marinus]|uniref:CLUMA_CG019687, isoform A n=1 Tax=Clunio marinus TaxID=568069 RepID=A0A1J1J1T6_9DIPT|nr:CLUMA_CG019687, isoform A [Clunio marinus]
MIENRKENFMSSRHFPDHCASSSNGSWQKNVNSAAPYIVQYQQDRLLIELHVNSWRKVSGCLCLVGKTKKEKLYRFHISRQPEENNIVASYFSLLAIVHYSTKCITKDKALNL